MGAMEVEGMGPWGPWGSRAMEGGWSGGRAEQAERSLTPPPAGVGGYGMLDGVSERDKGAISRMASQTHYGSKGFGVGSGVSEA